MCLPVTSVSMLIHNAFGAGTAGAGTAGAQCGPGAHVSLRLLQLQLCRFPRLDRGWWSSLQLLLRLLAEEARWYWDRDECTDIRHARDDVDTGHRYGVKWAEEESWFRLPHSTWVTSLVPRAAQPTVEPLLCPSVRCPHRACSEDGARVK